MLIHHQPRCLGAGAGTGSIPGVLVQSFHSAPMLVLWCCGGGAAGPDIVVVQVQVLWRCRSRCCGSGLGPGVVVLVLQGWCGMFSGD